MSDTTFSDKVVTSRKAHECDQCGRAIDAGILYRKATGTYDGEFYTTRMHVECSAAAEAYAELHGLSGDEYPWFQHHNEEREDEDWMRKHHPIVADRLGWVDEEPSP